MYFSGGLCLEKKGRKTKQKKKRGGKGNGEEEEELSHTFCFTVMKLEGAAWHPVDLALGSDYHSRLLSSICGKNHFFLIF